MDYTYPISRALFISLSIIALLSSCKKDKEPDPYAAVQGDWVYAYSAYAEYDWDDRLVTQTKTELAWWGPATMRVSGTDIVNYQTYSSRLTVPLPYTRTREVLTFVPPTGRPSSYMALNSPRTITEISTDSLVLRWRTPELENGTLVPYRMVEDHFARK